MRTFLILSLFVFAGFSTPLKAQSSTTLPEGGWVLQAGQRVSVGPDGSSFVHSAAQGQAQITSFKDMFSRPPRGTFRLERNRQHYREKELKGRQLFTLGKGALTELLYKKGRKHAEKSKKNSQKGKGSKSIFEALLGKKK